MNKSLFIREAGSRTWTLKRDYMGWNPSLPFTSCVIVNKLFCHSKVDMEIIVYLSYGYFKVCMG
jgi:hypothetical protein